MRIKRRAIATKSSAIVNGSETIWRPVRRHHVEKLADVPSRMPTEKWASAQGGRAIAYPPFQIGGLRLCLIRPADFKFKLVERSILFV
jgi:hypothetical protein